MNYHRRDTAEIDVFTLHDAQHQARGDARVDCVSSGPEDVHPNLRGEVMPGRDRKLSHFWCEMRHGSP